MPYFRSSLRRNGRRFFTKSFFGLAEFGSLCAYVAWRSTRVRLRLGIPDWRASARERRDPHGPAKTYETEAVLAAFGKVPLYSYELHIPMVVERDVFRGMVAAVGAWRPDALTLVQKRSLYGNWSGDYGGEQVDDVKFRRGSAGALGTFASTSDDALAGGMGEELRARFGQRCRYEREPSGETNAGRLMAGHLGGGHG